MVEEFFRTTRLIFRPFVTQDLDDLACIVSDPEVVRFTDDGKPLSRDTAKLWITRSRENVERFGYGTGTVGPRPNFGSPPIVLKKVGLEAVLKP